MSPLVPISPALKPLPQRVVWVIALSVALYGLVRILWWMGLAPLPIWTGGITTFVDALLFFVSGIGLLLLTRQQQRYLPLIGLLVIAIASPDLYGTLTRSPPLSEMLLGHRLSPMEQGLQTISTTGANATLWITIGIMFIRRGVFKAVIPIEDACVALAVAYLGFAPFAYGFVADGALTSSEGSWDTMLASAVGFFLFASVFAITAAHQIRRAKSRSEGLQLLLTALAGVIVISSLYAVAAYRIVDQRQAFLQRTITFGLEYVHASYFEIFETMKTFAERRVGLDGNREEFRRIMNGYAERLADFADFGYITDVPAEEFPQWGDLDPASLTRGDYLDVNGHHFYFVQSGPVLHVLVDLAPNLSSGANEWLLGRLDGDMLFRRFWKGRENVDVDIEVGPGGREGSLRSIGVDDFTFTGVPNAKPLSVYIVPGDNVRPTPDYSVFLALSLSVLSVCVILAAIDTFMSYRRAFRMQKQVYSSTTTALVTSTADGRIIDSNRAAATLFGADASEDLEGYSLANLFDNGSLPPPGDKPVRSQIIDTQHTRKPVEVSAANLSSGGDLRLYSITDLSDKDLFEKAIRDRDALYDALLRSAHDGILGIDGEHVIAFANTAALRMLNARAEDLLGKPLESLFSKPSTKALEAMLANTESSVNELTLLTFEGRELPIAATCIPSPDTGNAIYRAIINFRDYSVEHSAQRLRKQQLESLKEVNAELEQFGHMATHDMREPIRGISLYHDLALRAIASGDKDQALSYLSNIKNSAEQLDQLLHGLRSFARAGREAESYPLELTPIVQSVINSLKAAIDESGATITFSPIPGQVLANEETVPMVFQNLIMNALKFQSGENPPHISIGLAGSSDGEVHIDIRDNGIGIPSEHREAIFSPFKRLHSESEYPGSGIGLATTRKLMASYRGRVSVHSSGSEGTTFRLTFKAA